MGDLVINRWLSWRTGAAALVLLGLETATLLPVRARIVLAIHVVALGVLLAANWKWVTRGVASRFLWLWFAISMAPVLAAVFLGHPDPLGALAEELLPALAGWCVLLVLVEALSAPVEPAGGEDWRPGRGQTAAFLVATFAVLAIAHVMAVGRFAIISDEAIYLAQSRWMNLSSVTWSIDPDIAQFFIMRKIDYLDGHLYGMYPPGWPALLAAFRMIGLEWWSGVILGTTSVVLIYLVGAQLKGPRVGATAAILLATSQLFLIANAGYMAHAGAIAALLAATLCALRAERPEGWRKRALWVMTGALLGYVVTVRPLTGLALGLSIEFWMLLRAFQARRVVDWRQVAWVAAGGILPAVPFLAYNSAVLGRALALGYQVMHPGLYDLGFGPRGFRVLDANANWTNFTFDFHVGTAVRDLVKRLSGLNTTMVPVGLLAPVLAIASASGFRIAWGVIALFAVLPAAHFFYWYGDLRLYTELLPFMLLGVATMLVAIHARWPLAARSLFAMIIISQAIVALPWPPGSGGGHRPWAEGFDHRYGRGAPGRWATIRQADSLGRADGRVLLFSREASRFDNLIDRLYPFNGRKFEGPILVARDLGEARNAELIRRFPDRVPYLVQDRGPDSTATFTRIAR